MNRDKHTKGPWEFIPAGNRPIVQQYGRFPHGFICNVESLNFIADARLIAAAPAMLEALRRIEDYGLSDPELGFITSVAAEAIAKAEGRS